MKNQIIEISIGLIKINSSYLCLKRKSHPYQNFIEFPGGKRNKSESISACLIREIKEELNISIKKYKYIGTIKHLYNGTLIKINIFKIFRYDGEISSNENRDIVLYKNNRDYQLLPTHKRILNTLDIPRLLKIINIKNINDDKNLDLSLYSSIRLRGIDYENFKKFVKDKLLSKRFSGKIIIDYPFDKYWEDPYHGIHYSSSNIKFYNREDSCSNYLYSASCHTISDINECNQKLFDYLLLSPVLETHNNFNVLGWSKFSDLCLESYCPILALGGLSLSLLDYTTCIENYGFGIAGIRNI